MIWASCEFNGFDLDYLTRDSLLGASTLASTPHGRGTDTIKTP
jgi:hypothetical protein